MSKQKAKRRPQNDPARRESQAAQGSETHEDLEKWWVLAVTVTLAVSGVLISAEIPEIKSALLSNTAEAWLAWGTVGVSLFWIFRFIKATDYEIRMFKNQEIAAQAHLGDWQEYTVVIFLSHLMGCLIPAIPNLVLLCIVACALQGVDLSGVLLIRRSLSEVYRRARNKQQPEKGLNPVVREYYLDKPHVWHRIVKLSLFMVALALALAAGQRPGLRIAAWSVVLSTIVGGEVWLIQARRWRKQKLEVTGKNAT